MAEPAVAAPAKPVGRIVAFDVTFDDYLQRYAEHYHEWVRGYVIEMSPVTLRHEQIISYLRTLLDAWFERNPIGVVIGAPFVMRTEAAPAGRQPDLQVILESNAGDLTDTAMIGRRTSVWKSCLRRASIATMVRSSRSTNMPVSASWLIDPIRSQALFHRLTLDGTYAPRKADGNGNYATRSCPASAACTHALAYAATRFSAIGRAVDAMFAG